MQGVQGGSGSGSSPAPFLTKTYELVDDQSTNSIVCWSSSGCSFVVLNQPALERELLPKYFKHSNFSSFVRQLNTYGFRKKDPDQWEFANQDFIRGARHLLKNIQRRKPLHSHSLQNQVNLAEPLSGKEKQELEEKIECLKEDKRALMTELQEHTHQQRQMEEKILYVEDKLIRAAERQRSIMSLFRQMSQRPVAQLTLSQQFDTCSKKRRLPSANYFSGEAMVEENNAVSLPRMTGDRSDALFDSILNTESSLNSLENFIRSVSQAFGDEMYYDNTITHVPSAVVITELPTSSGETVVDLQPQSPKPCSSSPCLDINSSSDIEESATYARSPTIPISVHKDTDHSASEIDMNSVPVAPETDSTRDQVTVAATSTMPTGTNDVFWQQFLTENPGSSDALEVPSESRHSDNKHGHGTTREQGTSWLSRTVDPLLQKSWNINSVRNLDVKKIKWTS